MLPASPTKTVVLKLSFVKASERPFHRIKSALKKEPPGGQVIIDVKDCHVFDPNIFFDVIKGFQLNRNLLKGRRIIVLDPDAGVEFVLNATLKWMLHCPLTIAFSSSVRGRRIIVRKKILNIPTFLEDPLRFIEQKKSLTSGEVKRQFFKPHGRKGRANEYLRLLFRCGLLARDVAINPINPSGRPCFNYRVYSFPNISR